MKKTNRIFALFLLLSVAISGCSLLPGGAARRSNNKSTDAEVADNYDERIHDIYELYLANGGNLTYEEWLESIKGEKGEKGDKGDKGDTGPAGQQGQQGEAGPQGPQGIQGETGPQGEQGQQGEAGKDGQTPYIGENGHWWVGETDTGVVAGGQNGEPGVGISSIAYNGEGELVVTFDNGEIVNLGVIGSLVHQHEYECETLAPTCTVDGYYRFTCKTCGHVETVINKAQGHVFEAFREKVPATCTSEGVKSRKCTVCGYEETETIPAHDHTFSENCVYDAAKHWHYCTTCGVVVDEADHVFVDNVCSICSYVTSSNISSDGLLYALNEDGASYAVISVGTCTDTVIDIPSSYNGYPVTAISYGAFQSATITSITMPDTIIQLGSNAFNGCSSLTTVCLSNALTIIPEYCFANCSSLTSIVIPEGVKFIGAYAFRYCSSLTSVVLPNTLNEISYGAFQYCRALTSTIIPSSVRRINGSAFYDCRLLASVILNEGLKYLEYDVFASCRALTSITIPSTVYYIGSSCFNNCTSLTSVVFKQLNGWQHDSGGDVIYKELIEVPETAAQQLINSNFSWYNKYVPSDIGNNYSYLTLEIGGTVSNLFYIYPTTYSAPATYESSNEAVATVDENGVVTGVSNGVVDIIIKISGLTAVVQARIGNGEIDGNFAFYKISENEYGVAANRSNRPTGSIVIPTTFNGKNVTTVLAYGFTECYSLNSVVIPSAIQKIGRYAFGGSSSLKTVKFESAVPPQIDGDVFGGAWDYSDFQILVPNNAVSVYSAITADYWQSNAVSHIVGYNPDGE